MDIHAPDKPVHSIKDFGIHIAVVTIGILIALGLDGLRELHRERKLVRETRESFRSDMERNVYQMHKEVVRINAGYTVLDTLENDLPQLAKDHPDQVLQRLFAVNDPYYFFSTNSWEASLSTGALAHMSTDEAAAYAWAAESTRIYVGIQAQTTSAQRAAIAWWMAHPHPTADQTSDGIEKILLYEQTQQTMKRVAPETLQAYEQALEQTRHTKH